MGTSPPPASSSCAEPWLLVGLFVPHLPVPVATERLAARGRTVDATWGQGNAISLESAGLADLGTEVALVVAWVAGSFLLARRPFSFADLRA